MHINEKEIEEGRKPYFKGVFGSALSYLKETSKLKLTQNKSF